MSSKPRNPRRTPRENAAAGRLYSYDVFLRTRFGTVLRTVHLKKRSVADAGERARLDVQRVTRETCKVIDVVPLRRVEKTSKTTGRGRRVMTTTKVTFTRTRRAKARPSVRITQKGKFEKLSLREGELITGGEVTPNMRNVPIKRKGPLECENPACQKRGSCSHVKRQPGQERRRYKIATSYVRDDGAKLQITVWAFNEKEARRLAREDVKRLGLKGVRFAKPRVMS